MCVGGMVELTLEVGCSSVADGPGMVEFVWESGCSSIADGLDMGVCNGHMHWQFQW